MNITIVNEKNPAANFFELWGDYKKWLLLFKESIMKKAFTAMFLGAVIWIPIFYKIFVG